MFGMLIPGGAFVHVSDVKEAPPAHGDDLPYPSPPYAAIQALVHRYLGPVRRAGQGVLPHGTPGGEASVLRRAGFRNPQHLRVPAGGVLVRSRRRHRRLGLVEVRLGAPPVRAPYRGVRGRAPRPALRRLAVGSLCRTTARHRSLGVAHASAVSRTRHRAGARVSIPCIGMSERSCSHATRETGIARSVLTAAGACRTIPTFTRSRTVCKKAQWRSSPMAGSQEARSFFDDAISGRLDRRELFKRGAALGFSATVLGAMAHLGRQSASSRQKRVCSKPPSTTGSSTSTVRSRTSTRISRDLPDRRPRSPRSRRPTPRSSSPRRKDQNSTWDVYLGQTPFAEMAGLIEAGAIEPWDPYMPRRRQGRHHPLDPRRGHRRWAGLRLAVPARHHRAGLERSRRRKSRTRSGSRPGHLGRVPRQRPQGQRQRRRPVRLHVRPRRLALARPGHPLVSAPTSTPRTASSTSPTMRASRRSKSSSR